MSLEARPLDRALPGAAHSHPSSSLSQMPPSTHGAEELRGWAVLMWDAMWLGWLLPCLQHEWTRRRMQIAREQWDGAGRAFGVKARPPLVAQHLGDGGLRASGLSADRLSALCLHASLKG